MKKIVVGSTERALLFKDKQFVQVLGAGIYRFWNPIAGYTVEIFDISKAPELKGNTAKLILNGFTDKLAKDFVKVAPGAREVAIVYMNSQAKELIMPGEERLFWQGLAQISVKRFDISKDFELDRETIRDISTIADQSQILNVKVPEQARGLLLESGVIARELTPGIYSFWRSQRDLSACVIDTRLTALEVGGQEMLTKDKVSLRINLTVTYRMTDVVRALRGLSDSGAEIYRSAQLALRQAVGQKTLDELLESKEALNQTVTEDLSKSMNGYGIEIVRVGVKDIILPGDMRTLLNQVVEAEKAAQAQNIRRREETAATRSLLNTAKMMENNPVLLRLKELESVERISEKIDNLNVYNGLEGVMNGLVSLKE